MLAAAVLAAPAAATSGDRSYPQLTELASWLTGRPVQVVCRDRQRDPYLVSAYTTGRFDTHGGWHPGGRIIVERTYCDALLDLAANRGDRWYADTLAQALMLLVHETGHARGWLNESRAERWALWNLERAAARLGYGPDGQLLLLALAVRFQDEQAPARYRVGCSWPYLEQGYLGGCTKP